jgi:tetratricopeptide (TPR) repeat protein
MSHAPATLRLLLAASLIATILVASLVGPAAVHAQAAASDKAAAEALFDRGLGLMREGKLEEACIQLERSQAIERGIGTMLYLAECYEKLGRTASAWAMFREASSAARAEGQPDRAKSGTDRAAALAPRLSMLTIQVAPEAAIAGFLLTRNDIPVGQGLWNVPVPVDPGDHILEAKAPGHRPWSGQVTVGTEADSVTVRVPVLEVDPNAAVVVAASDPTAPDARVAPESKPPADSWPVQRTIGIVVGSVGVVGLGVGGYFGARAMSEQNTVDDDCSNGVCNSAAGAEAYDNADQAATLANVFLIGGAALAVTGVVVYLTASTESSEPHAALGLDFDGASGRVTLGGAF